MKKVQSRILRSKNFFFSSVRYILSLFVGMILTKFSAKQEMAEFYILINNIELYSWHKSMIKQFRNACSFQYWKHLTIIVLFTSTFRVIYQNYKIILLRTMPFRNKLELPILVIHISFHVKTRQSQVTNCQKFKFWNFAQNFTCDIPSEVVW